MDKPISMSVKDYLLRIMSVRTNIPLKTIEAVVEHQYNGVLEAMAKKDINSVEVSGFGKFLFNKKKSVKKWNNNLARKAAYEEELKNPELSEQKRKGVEERIRILEDWCEKSKDKIDGAKSDLGRVEKQTPPCAGYEADDRRNIPEEDYDLPILPTVLGEHEKDRVDNP